MKPLIWLLSIAGLCAAETGALTRIQDVRALTRQEAAKARSVCLRGVVTSDSLWADAFTMQSGPESIYLFVDPLKRQHSSEIKRIGLERVAVGMLVEVKGVTMPGDFAPCVSMESVELIGKGELPPAPPVTLPDLRTGIYDCRLVELEGVVRRMQRQNAEASGPVALELAAQDGSFGAFVVNTAGLAADLVDARVRLTGICLTYFNSRGEAVGVRIHVNHVSDVQILTPAPADPFAAPEVNTLSLRPFLLESPTPHRQRVSGVVTLSRAGEFIYVQTRDRGFRVDTRSREVFVPGDGVEAAGFVVPGEGFAMMTEAMVRKTAKTTVPVPIHVTPTQVLGRVKREALEVKEEDYDGTLVRLRGTLFKIDFRPGHEAIIYLDCDSLLISATLAADVPARALDHLLLGSEIEVTGVCSVRLDLKWPSMGIPVPESFSLLLQDPESIEVFAVPSWWTRDRILWLLGGLAVLLAVAFGWVGLLGATVRRQAARIESALRMHRDAELEFKAARRERYHLAADLHDGLQQLITGASYRMEGAIMRLGEIPPDAEEQFAAARIAMDRTRTGLRECMFGLRVVEEGPAEFLAMLRSAMDKIDHWPKGAVEITSEGAPFLLSRSVMGNLLLFTQEAVANAMQHGAASKVRISLRYTPTNLELHIEDDGSGFNPQAALDSSAGHFGLESMRHRLRWLGGSVEIESRPDHGTRIIARLPKARAITHEPSTAVGADIETFTNLAGNHPEESEKNSPNGG